MSPDISLDLPSKTSGVAQSVTGAAKGPFAIVVGHPISASAASIHLPSSAGGRVCDDARTFTYHSPTGNSSGIFST